MTRMAALRRAKRRKRGTMPGDHRGQETHSPWFVFCAWLTVIFNMFCLWTMNIWLLETFRFQCICILAVADFSFLFDGQTFTSLGGIFAQ